MNSSVLNGARAGARYVATHPEAWSNASEPDSATIEGAIEAGSPAMPVANDNAHITIDYYDNSGSDPKLCGFYDAVSGSWEAANGYTHSKCLIPTALIEVSVTASFSPLTPGMSTFFPATTSITQTARLLEEQ